MVLQRPAHTPCDECGEGLYVHVDAGAVERGEEGVAIPDADNTPPTGRFSSYSLHQTSIVSFALPLHRTSTCSDIRPEWSR